MTSSNAILDATQRDLLIAVLNRIVPSDGEMPGAGDLGVGAFVEDVVADSSQRRRLFLDGWSRSSWPLRNAAVLSQLCPSSLRMPRSRP